MDSEVPKPSTETLKSLRPKPASSIFRSITSPSNLKRIYHDHVEGKGAHGRDGLHPASLAKEIDSATALISRKLRAGNYRFTGYRELLELKGAGKVPRTLSIPTARDRIALRALADCLTRLFPKTRGVIPHQRVSEVADAVSEAKYDSYVKLDIENFYPSIRHDLIEKALRAKIRKKEIITAVLAAVKTPTVPNGQRGRILNKQGVPQGLAISNILAELIMGTIDDAISTLEECAYFRYVDDILILCNRGSLDHALESTIASCEEIGLKVHVASKGGDKSSTGTIAHGFSYLGYTFNSKVVSVREQSIRNIETSLARAFTRYKYDKNSSRLEDRVNLMVTGCIYGGVSYGWLNYFRQMNDLTLLKRFDVTIEEMKRRYGVSSTLRNKSFLRAYWAIRYPNGKDGQYIPNFDDANMTKMRHLLETHLGEEEAAKIADSAVPSAFKKIMRKVIVDLEKDIGHAS